MSKKVYGTSMHEGIQLIGQKARIISDNDNYDQWRTELLVIIEADNEGIGYDSGCFPEMLCSFKFADGTEFPCSLYEYEFELV